ncbi:MAG TPA: hypothetical protein VI756_15450 [Blastocatellia bacterium]
MITPNFPTDIGRPIVYTTGVNGAGLSFDPAAPIIATLLGPDPDPATRLDWVKVRLSESSEEISLPTRCFDWYYPFDQDSDDCPLLTSRPSSFSVSLARAYVYISPFCLTYATDQLCGKLRDKDGRLLTETQIQKALWFWLQESINYLAAFAGRTSAEDHISVPTRQFAAALKLITAVDHNRVEEAAQAAAATQTEGGGEHVQ